MISYKPFTFTYPRRYFYTVGNPTGAMQTSNAHYLGRFHSHALYHAFINCTITIQFIWNPPIWWAVGYWYSSTFPSGPELCPYSICFLSCPAHFWYILPMLLMYAMTPEAQWPANNGRSKVSSGIWTALVWFDFQSCTDFCIH